MGQIADGIRSMKRLSNTEETLVLTKDVKNPKPDRRYKRNWTLEPVWEQGTKFVVTTEIRERWHDYHEAELRECQSAVDALIAAGEEVTVETAGTLRSLKLMKSLGPAVHVSIQKRGTYDRVPSYDKEKFDLLMDALKPAKKDLKDVLGDYASDSYGGPIEVLKQLVKNGTLKFKQIERAVAELDPDHTVLDSILMAADEEAE